MTLEEYKKKYPNYYKCTHCGAPSFDDKKTIHFYHCTNIKKRSKIKTHVPRLQNSKGNPKIC